MPKTFTIKKEPEWITAFRQEFGIHFKNSSDELKFLEAFIEELKEEYKRGWNDALKDLKIEDQSKYL